jgi:AraC-like DNA-binding protein
MFIYAGILIRLIIREKNDHSKASNWYLKNVVFYAMFALLFSGYWITLWFGILPDGLDYIISAFMVFSIYMIGYNAFRQPVELFEKNNFRRKKNQKSQFIEEQTSKLVELLEIKKPWTDSELNLQKLAEIAKLSPHELSFIINSELNKNFADLIHEYRIREACRLLVETSDADPKILAIAFDVGYSNKATFNAAFKKITGMSPSAYKETARNASLKGLLN